MLDRTVKPLLTWIVTALLLCAPAIAPVHAQETRYISDKVYVPMRAGKGPNYRIVHRGLPSGTELTLLEQDEEYSLVRTRRGLEGWVPNQYLTAEPIAEIQLQRTRKQLEELQQRHDELKEKLAKAVRTGSAASDNVAALEEDNARLSAELENIKRVSADAIKLDQEYKKLTESYQVLKDQVDVLQSENARLRDNHENEAFLNGALAVVIGVLIAIIVPRLKPKKRSEWV